MFGGYEDIEAFEDYLYGEESSSEASIDSEIEFHLYSQVHYAQDLKDVNGQVVTEEAGPLEKQGSVSKQDDKNNCVVISDSEDIFISDSPDVVVLSDTPDEDSVYKSKAQKLTVLESPVLGRTYDLTKSVSPKFARDSSWTALNSKESTAETPRKKKRTNQQSVSFRRDGVRVIHKILVIEDSASDEGADDVASIVSDSDNVESWMLLGGARDDKDENILLNLEGCGTSTSEEGGAGWTIGDKDLEAQIGNYATSRRNNRYYMPDKNVTCRNCNKQGHLSKNCPSPKKIPACCLCARRGHLQNSCPARFCLNCSLPGHFSRECIERSYWTKHCRRCDMKGHHADACPEIWRQYHLTTKPGSLKKASSYSKHSALVYCYNCAKKGHYGYECSEQRMFRGTFPTFPFIYYYDNEHDIKRGAQRAKEKARELQEAGLLLVDLKTPHVDEGLKEHGHKKKRKKEHDKRKQKLPVSLKKKSPTDKFKERKLKKMLQNSCHTEKNFDRGGNTHALKRSKKTRVQHDFILPTNGNKPEALQASLRLLKKRKKKQRNHRRNSPTIDESLFLIKQRKRKSKHKTSC